MRDKHHWYRRVLKEMKQNKIVQQRLLRGDFDDHLTPADLMKIKAIREENKKLEESVTAPAAEPTDGK